jgi:hypothetical protein
MLLATSLLCIAAHAQSLDTPAATGFDAPNRLAVTPLPSNYQTIFENSDVLVMHVHYGAHEFVPTHDHPAFPTLFVYLNNSGEVDIIHAGPHGVTVHRPPTQAGAFRIAPALAERHSIQSHSDIPSDFLRVEFKNISLPDVPADGKRVPANVTPGMRTDFANASIRIDRIVCSPDKPCEPLTITHRSLLIALNQTTLSTNNTPTSLALGAVDWLAPEAHTTYTLAPGAQTLLITFLTPEAPKPASVKPCSF